MQEQLICFLIRSHIGHLKRYLQWQFGDDLKSKRGTKAKAPQYHILDFLCDEWNMPEFPDHKFGTRGFTER